MTVKLLLLQVAAPGVAAGAGRPVEPLAVHLRGTRSGRRHSSPRWRNPRHRTCASAVEEAPEGLHRTRRYGWGGRSPVANAKTRWRRSARAGPARTRARVRPDGLGFVMGRSSGIASSRGHGRRPASPATCSPRTLSPGQAPPLRGAWRRRVTGYAQECTEARLRNGTAAKAELVRGSFLRYSCGYARIGAISMDLERRSAARRQMKPALGGHSSEEPLGGQGER